MSRTSALRPRRAIAGTTDETWERTPMGRRPEEADDVRGTFAADGAIGFDPFPFLRALHDAGSHVVVIGRPKDHRRADERARLRP